MHSVVIQIAGFLIRFSNQNIDLFTSFCGYFFYYRLNSNFETSYFEVCLPKTLPDSSLPLHVARGQGLLRNYDK